MGPEFGVKIQALPWLFFGGSFLLGTFTGFVIFSQGAVFVSMGGQIAQGALSLGCFVMIGVVFWKFGWKIGLVEVAVILCAGRVGLHILNSLIAKY